ncbi:MAG TPA: CoA transferase [Acidimicrobiales bacterium]|jgi:crotonobetainyl-CoA:carnitine CoA-transferase CaiB-like acyl-CoA transferase
MNVLEGIKVVDVTAWAFVPSAGGVLAHWGAEVVKIESPAAPDPMRLLGGTLEPGGASWYFKHYSRGKRSIAVDLASDEGREVIYRLVAEADVFLTSYLPATRRKLKIDVDDIRAVNPRIIYARGSGQGPQGPEAERPGYDGITWWCRGSLAQSTMDVSGATWPTGMVGHGDGMSGMTLAGGVCAALLQRERTGETPVVDGSLLGTAVWFNGPAIIPSQFPGAPERTFAPATPPATHALAPPNMNTYQTKDHRFLNLLFLGDADRDWVDLCEHLQRPDLATDPRFAHAPDRMANGPAATAILDEIFASKTLEEWKQVLVSAKGAWSPVQTPRELYDDPQVVANGFLRHVDYPDGGLKIPVPPILFDEDAGDPPPAPDFAAHTDEVLREIGFDEEAIAKLRASGAVA